MIKLTEYFLKRGRVANMCFILIFLSGILASLTLERQLNPPLSLGMMKITTIYPGAGPEDVEINVTSKIEDQLLDVENVKDMSSMSMENISIIFITLDSDAGDDEKTKTSIRDAVARVADLPDTVTQKPLVEEIRTTNMPIMEIALNGDISELELRKYARDLESRMKDVPGVGGIAKIGYRKREIQINVDIKSMKKNQVSFAEMMRAVQARNVRVTGGTIESFVSEKKIVTLAEYEQLKDVGEVIIRSTFSGNRLKISDIAQIDDGFEDPYILYRSRGKNSIALVLTQQENADVITLSDNLKEQLNEFRKGLPENVKAEIIFDFSVYTHIMLDMVINNGLFGFVLVLLVMYIFLDMKSAFWAAFGIPFSIFGALIVFSFTGITLNQISLITMILVLGIIVDDAIVVSEKIYTLKQEGMESKAAVLKGVKEMVLPVSAAIITTILAFAPIMFIGGIFGKFLGSIPVVLALLLIFSWIESIIFLPTHVVHADPPKETPARIRWLEPVKQFYRRSILYFLNIKIPILIAFVLGMIGTIVLCGSLLKFVLDENMDPDFFAVIIEAPQGTSLDSTARMLPELEKMIENTVPEKILESYTTQVGHHDSDAGLAGGGGQYTNWAVITVYMIPAGRRDETSEPIMDAVREKLKVIKEKSGFQRLELVQLGGGLDAGKAVQLSYISNDDEALLKFEKETMKFLKSLKGVSSVESSRVSGKEELRLKLDYKRLAQVGITALDVAQTVRTAFDGAVVTSVRRQGEEIDYRIRLINPHKFRAEGVLKLPVANNLGALVPLDYFADTEPHPGPAALRHMDGKRSITILANVDQEVATPAQVNKKLEDKFGQAAAATPGLTMKMGGQAEEQMVSLRGLGYAAIVTLLGIYFLLIILFNSYRQPFLIMSIVPFSIAGVFVTLLIHGMPVTIVSLIGLLGLIGVVVNDTIVMIAHLNNKVKKEGWNHETIAQGAMERFRPVILTTLTTFAGLLPTCYGIGGDLPDIRPMVLTMAWGLMFTTIVTLGFIPLLYSTIRVEHDITEEDSSKEEDNNQPEELISES